jgi:hypothetical protein
LVSSKATWPNNKKNDDEIEKKNDEIEKKISQLNFLLRSDLKLNHMKVFST